jgi:hypothetical protein
MFKAFSWRQTWAQNPVRRFKQPTQKETTQAVQVISTFGYKVFWIFHLRKKTFFFTIFCDSKGDAFL